MKKLSWPEPGTYVIGVSGGVDSVSLLDMLSSQTGIELIVAHFDHGTRPDSQDDERFVAGLAKRYGLDYISERQDLGLGASEATARQTRYDFLRRARSKYKAKKIITAHHGDDVIETMIINLIRGTGWRGLCSLKNTDEIIRPFLAYSKADIVAYAKERELTWHEDPTNAEQAYLRNAVRHQLMPLVDKKAWLELYEGQKALADEIDSELAQLSSRKRYHYIMWPPSVAHEMIKQDAGLTRRQAFYALQAVKTARSSSTVEIGGRKKLKLTRETLVVAPFQP